MKPIDEQVKNLIECNCGEMYKSRGLSAPDCPQCNYAEDVIELMETYAKQRAVEYAQFIQDYWPDYRADEYYDTFINQS